MRHYEQGFFRPSNPKKYVGDVNNIVYRSGWERVAFKFCDQEASIVAWSSEELVIPYMSPVDGKAHRYFTDLRLWVRGADGKTKQFVIEIKPMDQVKKPRKTAKKKEATYLAECSTWFVNQAKWTAAKEWCKKNNAEFLIWTEKQLFPEQQTIKYKQPKKKA